MKTLANSHSVKSIVLLKKFKRTGYCHLIIPILLLLLAGNFLISSVHDNLSNIKSASESGAASRQAYIVLCTSDKHALPALVLFHRLKSLGSNKQFGILTSAPGTAESISPGYLQLFANLNVRVHVLEGTLDLRFAYLKNSHKGTEKELSGRDEILWQKLRVWELDSHYDKVVLLDTDLVLLRAVDELFQMPELSGCPMIDPGEKIIFYNYSKLSTFSKAQTYDDYWKQRFISFSKESAKSSQLETLVGHYGLNSGVVVLKPSKNTFDKLVEAVQLIPQRTCCPTQEFIFRFFAYKRPAKPGEMSSATNFYPLPDEYNVRRWSFLPELKRHQLKKTAKIYHFVEKDKPWVRVTGSSSNRPTVSWVETFCREHCKLDSSTFTFREQWWQHFCAYKATVDGMVDFSIENGLLSFQLH